MTISEVITRRQSGHLNKIKMVESDDPWELFALLLVCGQGKDWMQPFSLQKGWSQTSVWSRWPAAPFGRRFRGRRWALFTFIDEGSWSWFSCVMVKWLRQQNLSLLSCEPSWRLILWSIQSTNDNALYDMSSKFQGKGWDVDYSCSNLLELLFSKCNQALCWESDSQHPQCDSSVQGPCILRIRFCVKYEKTRGTK